MGRIEARRREPYVVLGLIITLFFIWKSGYVPVVSSLDFASATCPENVPGPSNERKDVQIVLEQHYYAPNHRITWGNDLPESKLVAHATGWTIVDNLYMMNGTLYIVTSEPETWPKRQAMISTGREKYPGVDEAAKRKPTDADMQILTPEAAQNLFRTDHATRLDGVSFHVNDPKQFLGHYFHWSAEVLFGLWRTYASLDPDITPDGRTSLPSPKRIMFPHATGAGWRDYARMNSWVTGAAFPGVSLEFAEDCADRADTLALYTLDRVVLSDRSAAGDSAAFSRSWRIIASAMEDLPGSEHWWTPLRRSVLEFSGVPEEWILGHGPATALENRKQVITYISRQDWGRRMLEPADHDRLVKELYALRDRYGYEVNVVNMQDLSRAEQFNLAARTTVMMGVHGNGLTALLWMRPTPRSTVIEFFFPTGFAFDYQYTAHALGIRHYGVWNDVIFTRPDIPTRPNYPEGFQGNGIPLDGAKVAKLVQARLSLDTDASA